MRSAARICAVLWITMLTCWSCAGSKDLLNNIPATLNSIKPATGFSKKIAIVLTKTPATVIGRQIGDRYFKLLVDTIRGQDHGLRVVTGRDADWPRELDAMLSALGSTGNALAVAESFRLAGYNAWACARIEDMWPVYKRSNFLWFRSIAGDSRTSPTSFLYATPRTNIRDLLIDFPWSLRASVIRSITTWGILPFISSAI